MLQNAFARLLKIGAKSSSLAICLAISSPSAATPGQPASRQVQGEQSGPALWVVRDADSTLYLFGTMHALSADAVWNGPSIRDAMAGSDEIWFEAEPPTDPSAIHALIRQFGIDRERPLSSRLSAAEMATFREAVGRLGIPAEQADAMRPWLAAISLAGLPLAQAGYDPANGADPLLLAAANAAGKRVRTFETAEQQTRFFADLPADVELELLRETLKSYRDGAAELRRMEFAWTRGDSDAVWELGGAPMRQQFPAVYAALLADRNRRWADTIIRELEGEGTDFIAVGALHLLGPDSVQSLLQVRGYVVERR